MSQKNPKIAKYLDRNGIYSPILSEKIRQEYKNSRVFKEDPVNKFINSVFKEKSEQNKHI